MNITDLLLERDRIEEQINQYNAKFNKEQIELNKKYIGKCFKSYTDINYEETIYYKVINVDEFNRHNLYCFYFSFKEKMYSGLSSEDICGFAFLNLFKETKDENGNICKELDGYDQISNEEYDDAFTRWIDYINKVNETLQF